MPLVSGNESIVVCNRERESPRATFSSHFFRLQKFSYFSYVFRRLNDVLLLRKSRNGSARPGSSASNFAILQRACLVQDEEWLKKSKNFINIYNK